MGLGEANSFPVYENSPFLSKGHAWITYHYALILELFPAPQLSLQAPNSKWIGYGSLAMTENDLCWLLFIWALQKELIIKLSMLGSETN